MAEQKATRNFERFYIPQREHSKLIGRGGETLKGIEKRLSVRIRIPNRDEKSDLVTVQSVSQDDPAKVLKAVKAEFEDILDFPIGTSPLLTIKLDIPAGKYGALIGAKGATLKEIQAKSGAVLNIPKKEEQTADSKVVAVGSKAALQKLVSEVASIIGFRPPVIGEAIDSEEARVQQPKLDLVSNPINEALFFPERPDSDAILNRMLQYLRSASKSIEVAVYNMTDDRIARALEEQHQAGVQVRIITHYSTMVDPGSDIHTMAAIGAQVKVDVTPQLMHHKFALIDDQVLLNGSFNWTRSAAEGNAENIIITNQPDLVKAFSVHFDKMWGDNDRLQVLPPHGTVTPKDAKAKVFGHSD